MMLFSRYKNEVQLDSRVSNDYGGPIMKMLLAVFGCVTLCIVSLAQTAQTNRLKSTAYRPSSKLLDESRPDDCAALLKDGVFDEHDIFGSSFQVGVFLNRFCSSKYTTYDQASSDGLNIGVPIDGFMASLGFTDAKTNFSTDYQTMCSQQDSFAQSNKVSNEVIRMADANLAQQFTQCVQGKVFSAYLEPTDAKQFQIIVDYHPIGDDDCKVTDFSYDHSAVSCDNPPKTGWLSPTKIGPGGLVINCKRNDENTAVQLALNTSQGKEGFRLQAAPPPAPAIPTGDALFNYLPVGTILALARLPVPLPKGWFLSDGQNGTVDLVDRMPLGSVAGQVITGTQNSFRGTTTGPTTSGPDTSDAGVGGHALSSPASNGHTHPLPIMRVYFIQRVN
jgi:hypothetical protein